MKERFFDPYIFFKVLKELTGWTVINSGGENPFVPGFCPQIEIGIDFNEKVEDDNFASIWWSNAGMFKLCCRINGKYVYPEQKIRYKKIDSITRWCKKCELMIRKAMIQKASEGFEV